MPSRDHDQLHAAAGAAAVESSVARLRSLGERVTMPRRAVLETLAAHAGHLTADEVAELLVPTEVHRATVYRTLDLLVATGIVSHRHTSGGATRYHVTAPGEHDHLHGHCHGCGTVVPLPVDAFDDAVAQVRASDQFALDIHRSTFSGRCRRCIAASGGT